jgi:MOB kinase activator 1
MEWVDSQISDRSLFPPDEDSTSFPPEFRSHTKTVFKRLFRVYAHIYHSHFTQFVELGAEVHLNTCFKRFVFFILEFDLVEKRELAPLHQLINSLSQDPLEAEAAHASAADEK